MYETGTGLVARIGRWGGIVAFFVILALPPAAGLTRPGQNLIAVTVLMAAYWLTQAIPLAVTSLLPLLLFPVLGIQAAKGVSGAYINDNVFLYLGGFIIALAIERCGLHTRIALNIVKVIGSSPRRLVLGFMCATAFLSMWISNTASTLLMLPIGTAILAALAAAEEDERSVQALGVPLMLSIAYAASIGGMMTLVGTPTNIAFLQVWRSQFPDAPTIGAGQWMLAFVPYGVAMLAAAWALLVWKLPRGPSDHSGAKNVLDQRLSDLGPMSPAERRMSAIFFATAALWIFRKPLQFGAEPLVPGWGGAVESLIGSWTGLGNGMTGWINDSTVAMGMAMLLFVIPSGHARELPPRPLMDWKTAETLPWAVLLLIGGGFALADGFRATGLSQWVGGQFAAGLHGMPPVVLVIGICLLMTFLTEFTTNVATVSALLPILAATSVSLGIDPRLIMIPATISTSCAFMLPIATPPNAIVFGSGRVSIQSMCRTGIMLNLIGVLLLTLITYTVLIPVFGIDVHNFPSWADLSP